MLNGKQISIIANTVVDDNVIARHSALLEIDSGELSMATRYLDKPACKEHREVVRADAAEFEDFAYSVQESVMNAE